MGQLHAVTEGSGADVVLLHGWGMNGRIWSSLLPRLADHYRLTVVDLPGHGGSPSPSGSDPGGWVEMLLEAAPPQAIWVGWSLGGMLALLAAAARPERVQAVATIASNLRFVASDDWSEAVSPALFQDMVDGVIEEPVRTLQRFVALQFIGVRSAEVAALSRRLRARIAASPPDAHDLVLGLELLRAIDNRSLVGALRVPQQMIFGARDKLVPVGAAKRISAMAPAAEVVTLDGAGHAPFLTHPDALMARLQPFLQRHAC